MFSSDMTAEELRSRLGHVSVPVLSVFSLADEYVPKRSISFPFPTLHPETSIPTPPFTYFFDRRRRALARRTHHCGLSEGPLRSDTGREPQHRQLA